MSTQATFGTALAWRRNSISGAVYSWPRPRRAGPASAVGRVAIVAPWCAEPDATDARRVDEDEAAGEQRAGQLDLRVREPPLVPGLAASPTTCATLRTSIGSRISSIS